MRTLCWYLVCGVLVEAIAIVYSINDEDGELAFIRSTFATPGGWVLFALTFVLHLWLWLPMKVFLFGYWLYLKVRRIIRSLLKRSSR